ncbi:MAG: MJ1477/TM1410 family putative glycoside hydrolase [Candidatus Eremiobacterota bacterium]
MRQTLWTCLLLLCLAPAMARERDWDSVTTWAYQLQNLNLPQVAASDFDLIVVDYSADGGHAERYTRAQVAGLQRAPGGGHRLVLAYLSIGEAEDYRYYWKAGFRPGKPPWLEGENPDWPGNYRVRYWDPAWRQILHGYLDHILAAGFDGVYLDLVDAYEFYEERGRPRARDEMVALVLDLAGYARKRAGPDFGVFPQNAEGLLDRPEYLAAITGIGREEVFFGWEGLDGAPPPAAERRRIQGRLDRAVAAGKLVLAVDYTTSAWQAREAHRQALARGYREYVGPRELDALVAQPAVQASLPVAGVIRVLPWLALPALATPPGILLLAWTALG